MPYKNPEDKKRRNKQYYIDHKEEIKESANLYYQNNKDKVLKRMKQYHIDNREDRLSYLKEWSKTNKKESDRRYLNTEKGKIAHRRACSKRKRNLKFIPLFVNPFPEEIDVDYHHINNLLVIPLPRCIHNRTLGGNHRNECKEIIKSIYGFDLDKLLEA